MRALLTSWNEFELLEQQGLVKGGMMVRRTSKWNL